MYARLDVCGRLVEGDPWQIRDLVNLENGEEAWLRPCKLTDSKLSRKASKFIFGCPYRKPTQVDEERILRRTCEPSFRNSAI